MAFTELRRHSVAVAWVRFRTAGKNDSLHVDSLQRASRLSGRAVHFVAVAVGLGEPDPDGAGVNGTYGVAPGAGEANPPW